MPDTSETTRIGSECLGWWAKMQPQGTGFRGNSGALAALRHARSPVMASMIPEVADLHVALGKRLPFERVCTVAPLLAWVRGHVAGRPFATQCATPSAGRSSPPVSEVRFVKVLQANTSEELTQTLRRLVQMLDGQVNVYDLSESMFDLIDPTRAERRRLRWAEQYFANRY